MTPMTHMTGVQVIAVHARADGPNTSTRHMRHAPAFGARMGWRNTRASGGSGIGRSRRTNPFIESRTIG